MRVTEVSSADGYRGGRFPPQAVLPPAMSSWRPGPTPEEAPPVPEPDKGLRFDGYA